MFEVLSPELWAASGENPVWLLRRVPPARLEEAAADPTYLGHYAAILAAFDAYLTTDETPFTGDYPDLAGSQPLVAYFSAEFGLHASLPIYSGGLGVLAGDHCKAASDLGLPFVGVGLLYPQGYFRQTLDADGRQEARYEALVLADAPLTLAMTDGLPVVVEVGWRPAASRHRFTASRSGGHRAPPGHRHPPTARTIASCRHGSTAATRRYALRQEIVLGFGGVRALRKLGIAPRVWHMNEGHSAFPRWS